MKKDRNFLPIIALLLASPSYWPISSMKKHLMCTIFIGVPAD
jgi:hypothetical protein